MTNATTGNSIVDAQARAGASRAKQEEARKNSAARKTAKASKSADRKSAGKRAAARGEKGGKGIGIIAKRARGGKSFGGLLSYMMNDPTATLISSNCGTDKDGMKRYMRACAQANPKIMKPVQHIILALPAGQKKTSEEWAVLVDTFRNEIGIDDSYPYTAVRHKTDKGQDLHIALSRVNSMGEVMDTKQDFWAMQSACQVLEERFNLKLVPYSEMKSRKTDTPDVSHTEVKQSVRTQIKPPRLVVSDAIKMAKKDKPTVQKFIKRLRAAGVIAAPYVLKNEMKGFSFSHDGQSFKGRDVAASWTTLSKELNYEQARDITELTELSAETRVNTKGLEPVAVTTPSVTAEVQRSSDQMERPTGTSKNPARKAELARQTSQPYLNDPIALKFAKRQKLIDRLRREEGSRKQMAHDLADAIERAHLYRQDEAHRQFMKMHPTAQAREMLREFVPDARVTAHSENNPENIQQMLDNLKAKRDIPRQDDVPERVRQDVLQSGVNDKELMSRE